MMTKCANYMNSEGARETVAEHLRYYGPPDEPEPYDLSEMNITRNCCVCDFGGTGSKLLDGYMRLIDDTTIQLQETVKELTGEFLKRVCFKELPL